MRLRDIAFSLNLATLTKTSLVKTKISKTNNAATYLNKS
jgi:hypothetical protein